MRKHIYIPFLLLLAFWACKNEPEQANTAIETAQPNEQQTTSDRLAELKANAFDEEDRFGRVNHSLGMVQKQFAVSNQMNTPKGKQGIFVDERFTIVVRSEVNGDIFDAKVNLKNLNPQNGGMRLLPDKEPGDMPGFAISVLQGKPGVELLKNEEKIGEERELKIYMADRTLIEQSVPAFLAALNVAHGIN